MALHLVLFGCEVFVMTTRMKAARLRHRYSQTTLAAKAERLSPSDISKFENGRAQPYPAQAERIAKVLGLEPAQLLEPAEAQAQAS